MRLARKNLLDHIEGPVNVKEEDATVVAVWRANDLKAFSILSTTLSTQYQSMIRNTTSTKHLWDTLKDFFVRKNLHDRMHLRRQLHDFKMERGSNLMEHMMKFDKLTMSMSAIGDVMAEQEMLVVLLGSLSEDYEPITSIIVNFPGIDLMSDHEMLQREWDNVQEKEIKEVALKATRGKYQKTKSN
uniref:Putative polyprotein n=1 Tax=Albugo laibachii Nc14 TaxID=890382 RepID=F0WQP9_9STRA|nr:putative polyprotein [Albugo laibachii Nc14]|eukprot:CCA23658.1 putative polyprotein [Albugo laibachii Nc14]